LAQVTFDLLFIAEYRTVSASEANQVFFFPLKNVIQSDFLPASVATTLQWDLRFYRPCRKRQHRYVLSGNASNSGDQQHAEALASIQILQ
jgi:hypothetical protein